MSNTKKEKTNTTTLHIRDISNEAHTAMKMAAKKSNKKMGVWLSEVVLMEAQKQLTGKQEIAKPEDVTDVLKDMFTKLQELSDKVNQVNKPWWNKIMGN